ncbi:MAG: hypothetical protein ACFCGT_02520 [Sandaracinaceae bacterium]
MTLSSTRPTLVCGLVLAALALGCGEEALPTLQPVLDRPLDDAVDAVLPLPDGRLVLTQGEDITLLDPGSGEVTAVATTASVGALQGAEILPDDGLLLFAERGTFIVRGTTVLPSPFGDALDGPVRMLLSDESTPGATWVLTDASLSLLEGLRLTPLDLPVTFPDVRIARARRPGGGPALWVIGPEGVLETWVVGTEVRVARLLLGVEVLDAVGDGEGQVWLRTPAGLHVFDRERQLRALGIEADALHGASWSDEVWVVGPDGAAWLVAEGRLHAVEDVAVEGTPGGVDPRGALVTASPTGIRRYAPRRIVAVEGPPDGSYLVAPTTFPIRAEAGYRATAFLDGEPLEIADDATEVRIAPADLSNGPHELRIRVAYDDGTLPSEVARTFEVINAASWRADVEPLFADHCAGCHDEEGPAVTLLNAPDLWQTRIDEILLNVRDGRMPLGRPPLAPRSVAVIEAWALNDFPME